MAIYLDTSVVASMFLVDAHSPQVALWLRRNSQPLTLSDWTVTEFTSATLITVRAGRIPAALQAQAERMLDSWIGQQGNPLAVQSEDVRQARRLISETGEPLRAPDALHLAIVRRRGHVLATLDDGMREAATDLGLTVEDLSPHA